MFSVVAKRKQTNKQTIKQTVISEVRNQSIKQRSNRLRSGMSAVCEKIKQLDEDSIIRLKSGEIDQLAIEGFQIGPKDIKTVFRKKEEHFSFFEAQSDEKVS